jgi:hypothetical protein
MDLDPKRPSFTADLTGSIGIVNFNDHNDADGMIDPVRKHKTIH